MLTTLKIESQGRSRALLKLEAYGWPALSGVQAYAASCDAPDTADGTPLRAPFLEVTPAS